MGMSRKKRGWGDVNSSFQFPGEETDKAGSTSRLKAAWLQNSISSKVSGMSLVIGVCAWVVRQRSRGLEYKKGAIAVAYFQSFSYFCGQEVLSWEGQALQDQLEPHILTRTATVGIHQAADLWRQKVRQWIWGTKVQRNWGWHFYLGDGNVLWMAGPTCEHRKVNCALWKGEVLHKREAILLSMRKTIPINAGKNV